MLVRVGALLVRQPTVDRALQVLRRLGVIAVIELLQADLERRGLGLHGAENRPPRRVTRLRRRELERGREGERLAKLVAAGVLAGRGAVNESEVLVGARALGVAEPLVERALQVLRRLGVIAVIELLQTDAQRRDLGLHGAKNRPPYRVTCLRRLERGREGERPAEFVAAQALAVGNAVNEGEMLVRVGALLVRQPTVDRDLQVLR